MEMRKLEKAEKWKARERRTKRVKNKQKITDKKKAIYGMNCYFSFAVKNFLDNYRIKNIKKQREKPEKKIRFKAFCLCNNFSNDRK